MAARVEIPIQALSPNGGSDTEVTLTAGDASNHHYFSNNGKTILLVKNASGGPLTVTVSSVACSHGRTGDLSITIADGKYGLVSQLDPHMFNQIGAGNLGKVFFSVSTGSSVSLAAISYQ